MDKGVGGLAGDDNQPFSFFKLNICYATDEVVAGSGGDSANGSHCTGDDDENIGGVGAGGVTIVVGVIGDEAGGESLAGLRRVNLPGCVGEDYVGFNYLVCQQLSDYVLCVNLARCTGYAYRHSFFCHVILYLHVPAPGCNPGAGLLTRRCGDCCGAYGGEATGFVAISHYP